MKNSQVMTLASSIIFAGGCSMVSGPPELRDMGGVFWYAGLALFIGSAITMARHPGS